MTSFLQGQVLTAAELNAALALIPQVLAGPGGALTVGWQQAISGAVLRTAADRFEEAVSILDIGAKDDWNGATGTNCFAALETLFARRPIRIRVPRTVNGTGVYLYSGNTALTDATGVVLDIDEGVKFVVQGASYPPFILQGIRTTRPLVSNWSGGPAGVYSRHLGPHLFEGPSAKGSFLTRAECSISTPILLNGTVDFAHLTMSGAWPNGALVAAAPGGTIASNQITWTAIPAANFSMSVTPVVPGDELHAQMSSGTYLPAIAIETDGGWALIRQDQTSVFSASTLVVTESVAGVTTEYSVLVSQAGFAAYQMYNAVVGVKILGPRTFALMLNNIVMKRVTLHANILSAGWGGGFATSGGMSILHMVAMRRKQSGGLRQLSAVCLGDSTGDRTVTQMSQFEWMGNFLAGLGGTQLTNLTNLATSGDTSAQQLTKLQAINVANYDYGLIQIGINDIQTGVSASTFVGNITSMVSYLRASNVEPIVGIPAQFYSAAEAANYGQGGGTTTNSSAGSGHRILLLETLATLGVPVNVLIEEDMGAVNPALLQLDPTVVDPIIYDNIHPTSYGSMLCGFAWAKVVGAHALGTAESTVRAATIPARWFLGGVGATNRGSYSVTPEGVLSVSFRVTRDGVSIANATVIATLPARLRPPVQTILPIWSTDNSDAPLQASYLSVGADGTVKAYNVHAAAFYLSGSASWSI